MTLQPGWDKTEKVNAVTSIFGYDENVDPTDSAIPVFLDDWFHGDFRTNRPSALSEAIGTKNLEEYTEPFPNWRINSVIEIGFDTPDGQTIPDSGYEITMEESEQAAITLEGEPGNPFRNEYDYDGAQNYLKADEKGPYVAKEKLADPIGGVEGVRGSIIYGGSDKYISTAKMENELEAILTSHVLPKVVAAFFSAYFIHITTFYTFVDFVFMADGTKVVRMWDASRYPAHALYVGGRKVDQNQFEEGVQWTTDAYLGNNAFENFAREGNTPGLTPFDQFGSFGYRSGFRLGTGPHPVGFALENGNILTVDEVQAALPEPLFPSYI